MGYPEENIQLRGIALTDVGRVRSHNEDSVHLWHNQGAVLLGIVADGMGGAAAGEEASRIAIETVTQRLGLTQDNSNPDALDMPAETLREAVQDANLNIIREAIEHPKNKGMGTTITMVFINGQEARFAHVGDSRAYRVNALGEIEQITSDHSFVQALIDAGHITPEQAETHPMRNVLYRALGQTRDLDVDTYDTTLTYGDKLVLCSDGLTGHVRAPEIAKIAHENKNPYTISEKLIALANSRGGEDNISVIVIVVDDSAVTQTLNADNRPERIIDTDDGEATLPLNPVRDEQEPPEDTPRDRADYQRESSDERASTSVAPPQEAADPSPHEES